MSDSTGSRKHQIFDNVIMGTGTWAWGDRLFWGFGRGYTKENLSTVFHTSLNFGINFFDTAEVYGQGKSETFLGEFMHQVPEEQQTIIATKFMPYPWRLGRKTLLRTLARSLKRLNLERVDLYQIHWPFPPITIETWMEAMIEAHQNNLISAVGVSNYNYDQMQRAYDALNSEGIPLASNQVEYSLLNRKIEKNGLLKGCKDEGIILLAYSPLAQGILTGKYPPESPPTGLRGRRYTRKYLQTIQPLVKLLKKIGAAHAGKTASQVAINWVIQKGAVPIPGAKTIDQIEQNAGALGWQLTGEEIEQLDHTSTQVIDAL